MIEKNRIETHNLLVIDLIMRTIQNIHNKNTYMLLCLTAGLLEILFKRVSRLFTE